LKVNPGTPHTDGSSGNIVTLFWLDWCKHNTDISRFITFSEGHFCWQ